MNQDLETKLKTLIESNLNDDFLLKNKEIASLNLIIKVGTSQEIILIDSYPVINP